MSRLTTGEVARLCSVQPDTVLKWIKAGRLPATRTAGGHHRVDARDLAQLQGIRLAEPGPSSTGSPLRCWEYHAGRGRARPACQDCLVYKARAAWCFELRDTAAGGASHAMQFCTGSCDSCAYFQRVTGAATRLLVISRDEVLAGRFQADGLTTESSRNGYQASAVIERFRPHFVVLDCAIACWSELFECLAADYRVVGLKIILAVDDETPVPVEVAAPEALAGVLVKPFGAPEVLAVINRFPVEHWAGA